MFFLYYMPDTKLVIKMSALEQTTRLLAMQSAQEQALSLKGVRPMIKKPPALLYKRAYNMSRQLFYRMANCKEKTLDTILRFVYDSRGEDNE